MPSSYSSNLRLTLPLTGENSGTWGDLVNDGITALTDAAIAGTAAVTMTAADKTLSTANGATDEARQMFVALAGTPGASFNVIVPTSSKLYFVKNGTGFAQTVKTTAGTGISVPTGTIMALYCDGTNVVEAITALGAVTTIDINGGTVDGTVIGGASAAAGSFTTVSATGTLTAATTGTATNLNINAVNSGGTAYFGIDSVAGAISGVSYAGMLIGPSSYPFITRIGSTNVTTASSTGLAVTGALSATGALTTAGIKEDASGNLGLGVTPSAWSGHKVLELPNGASIAANASVPLAFMTSNAFYNGANWVYKTSYSAEIYVQDSTTGAHRWEIAPSGTAGNPITFTTAMTLDASGNLSVGTGAAVSLVAWSSRTDNTSWNGANTAVTVGKNTTTGRSLGLAGTLNQSGADYAEYEHNNGLTIAKGSLVGFKADGTLTLTYADAVRFAVKSTDPGLVGGDTWGTEDKVGKRPTQPAEDAEQADKDTYAAELAVFEAALEAARQLVDRIAYSGKVPCNVLGATPGGYIIAAPDLGGGIHGFVVSKADMTFGQYQDAVGRVNRILPDGRCEVAVIIH